MGIFIRTVDIVNANVNALLDKAEDPEKLARQMIREMEETLIEIKAACAGTMAGTRKLRRIEEEAQLRVARWNERAKRAVEKGRDDLAREALVQKRRHLEEADRAATDAEALETLESDYKDDIVQLEEKLQIARERQRSFIQRRRRAENKVRAEREIRKLDTSTAFVRFEELEYRLDRTEAEAELINFARPEPKSLEEQFAEMERDGEIEDELSKLKQSVKTVEPVGA